MSKDYLYMLWTDNSPLGEKVQKAVEHYKQKYGQSPTVLIVPNNVESPKTYEGMSVYFEDLGSLQAIALGELLVDPRNEKLN